MRSCPTPARLSQLLRSPLEFAAASFRRDAVGDGGRRNRENPARTGGLNRARAQEDGERRGSDRKQAAEGEDEQDARAVECAQRVVVGEEGPAIEVRPVVDFSQEASKREGAEAAHA